MSDPTPEHIEAGLKASADALANVVSNVETSTDPKDHIHLPALHHKSTSWLNRFISPATIDKLEASYHMGNYVIDRATGTKSFEDMSFYVRVGMHLLYYGSLQSSLLQVSRTQQLLKSQSVAMGKQYDSPESKSHIRPFIESFQLQDSMAEMEKPDPDSYETFNEFFARKILPSARPNAEPENPAVISSPADCRMTTYPTTDLATQYWIKGFGFTLGHLLGSLELAEPFIGGAIIIARLAPQDYHRWHAPVAGTVLNVTDHPGTLYTVNPQAINQATTLDVFCENKRSVMLLQRATTGRQVAVIAIGAMLVGSIKWDDEVTTPGAEISRGQPLGAFYYGGSTVLVLFEPGDAVLDEDLVHNSTEKVCETIMKVGWRVGQSPSDKAGL